MSLISNFFLVGLLLFSNGAISKSKGPLALEIIPSQTKYDDPNLDITLTGKATVAQDYNELTMDWILPPEVELVQGTTTVNHNDVKAGTTVHSEIVVRFKSSQWKVVFSVYELQDGVKYGTTQILTPPESDKVGAQSTKAMKSQVPYSLKGLKIIH
ncbi:MAG: hypothetical protein SGJ18_01480 [Pseudomonadota bacterium]|nr:hypothetical protein [Pseudomonadota bacterium]